MGNFNQQTVNDYGGVAWAKQVAESMDPGAIDSQIQGYQSAVRTLATVQTTLQNVKNNLAASWSGDAADQAQTSFQASINHAQETQETISQTVIPPLQSAQSAQQHYITTMSKVPDEQTVPSNSVVNDVEGWFGAETPAQKAETHNTTARTQAAGALNTLSDSYDSSASKLTAVGNSQGDLNTTGGNSGGAFDLGPASSSSGNGAASGYSESVHGGSTSTAGYVSSVSTGSVGNVSDPKTTLAGTSGSSTKAPVPDPIWTTNPSSKTTSTPEPDPIWGDPDPIESSTGNNSYNKSGLITDDPEDGVGGGLGDGLGEEGVGRNGAGSSSGVFDETGLGDGELTGGTGSGLRGGTSNSDGTSLVSDSEGTASGAAEGEASETGMGGGAGRGAGGAGADDEDLGSSRYSRGRFFDEEDEDSGLSPVRSAYEGATDADGNKVNMMAPGRRGAQEDDEEDERQKRPSYLKEDEFWKNAQRIVPPVIQ
jgi:uncharacterized protein YukE